MKKLLFVLMLLYCGTQLQAQGLTRPRLIDTQLGYGMGSLGLNGFHLNTTMFWNKPLGWSTGFRISQGYFDLAKDTQNVNDSYVRAMSWFTGLDYKFTDDYSKHEIYLNASLGMALYTKALTPENFFFRGEETIVASPHLRLAGRYQYQFGIFGLYVQPWGLVGTVQEFGADFGIVLRKENW